ncbi:MAG TPA: phosphoribosylformylglycinamidine synthase subunit PurS [Longimicrobiales bacterium]|nr:phosphoribosylformylglycinamidine synthase subunit PurS [Longimicrobiales bacterium]
MSNYLAEVRVTPRAGLLDPEGKAIESALHSLDFPEAQQVRVGRLFRLQVKAGSAQDAQARVDAMCRKLLANPVTEDYEIALEQTS